MAEFMTTCLEAGPDADDAVATRGGNGARWINFALRLPESIRSRIRIGLYRTLGMQIGSCCRLGRISVPRNPWDIHLADGVALDDGVVLVTTGERGRRPRITIGTSCYVNRNVCVDASLAIEIGRNVMIGPFGYLTDHDHGTAAGATISEQPLVAASVTIEDDAWLGAHVCVLKGVRIGTGAVVGAGAVVTRDVPPGAIVAGVPARVIGRRGEVSSTGSTLA